MDPEKGIGLIAKAIDSMQGGISAKSWQGLSRKGFQSALEDAVDDLDELRKLFDATVEGLAKDAGEGMPDIKPLLQEMHKLQRLLEKNLSLEKGKKPGPKEFNVMEKEETPELYADLEQRVLALLLKARFALERLGIFLRKEGLTPITDRSTAQQVMEVLQRKEDELQQLRGKYEDIRKRSYLGHFEEGTIADLEQDLVETGKRMALSADELGKSISFHKGQIEYIENSYAELGQKLDSLQEHFSNYSERAEELIKALKKERDYAKKIVLDVEHETVQLRNSYTQEMLNLQQSKLAAKREAEKRFAAEAKKLQGQLREQQDLVKHFRKISEEKLRKEAELEEKMKRYALLLKAKETHDAVKKRYRKARKKRKKTRKK